MQAESPSDERKLVTVLFADLVGSTALGAKSDPERTRAMLGRFYDAMAGEVEAAGGTVEKFVGDAVMAAFGAPAALEDHAERALHAALAMRNRLGLLFRGELSLRFGVNTGEVVVGGPREGSSFVTGDAVNVAARLEQAAAPSEILVGERTAALVRGAFELGEPRRVEAKGKKDGVLGVPVLRALSLMRPRGVGGLHTAFVGRDNELELLLATYGRAVEQAGPHMVTLMADVGVGKTRLVRELWDRLGGESPVPLRRAGRCLAYGHGITYWPLGEILKEHLGILESDPPETVRQRLGPRGILGLALGLDTAGELHPFAARDRLHDAWVELLDELAAERPVVLLVEDLHWADESLLDLMERLLRDIQGPLFLIGTARPELLDTRPSWGGGIRNASLLWLEPLRTEQTAQLIDDLLAATLPEQLRETIVERAEGNPFFVEELLATLIDRGVLAQRGGEWQAEELPAEFELPDTVQAVVAARMDLLPPMEKAALQAAAVAGRVFWEGSVRELLGGGDPRFELLEGHDFVRRRTGTTMEGEREWAIKHSVTREVAYASIPKARRAHLHAAFAAWLERAGAARDEYAPLLAHHYSEAVRAEDADLAWADDPERLAALRTEAVRWLRRAGELAVSRYDVEEAVALLQHAIELEGEADAQAEIWREIGRAYAIGYRGLEFTQAMERSLELTDDPHVRGATLAELGYQASFRAGMWTKAPERGLVSSWIENAKRLTEAGTLAHTRALCAELLWNERPSAATADEAASSANALRDRELQAAVFAGRSMMAFSAGRYEESLALARGPSEFIDELHGDPEWRVEVHEMPIAPEVMLGHFDAAAAFAERHDHETRSLTAHHQMHSVAILAELSELRGEWQAVRSLTARVEQTVAANLETPCVRNQRTLLVCAAADYALGDSDSGERLEAHAESLAMEGYDWTLAAPRLRIALMKDDAEAIERLVEVILAQTRRPAYWLALAARPTALDALVRLGDRERVEELAPQLLEPPHTYLEPFALRALGQVRGERALIEQALTRFQAMRLDWHVAQTRKML